MELQVMKWQEKHMEECVDLFMDTFSREPWNEVYDSRKQVVEFLENHRNNNYFVGYVGMVNEKIVALSIGMKKPWIGGMEYYIDEFCVGYEYQGKGIGGAFLKKIEEMLPEEQLEGFMLNTERYYPSYQFYIKNGFEQMGNAIVLVK